MNRADVDDNGETMSTGTEGFDPQNATELQQLKHDIETMVPYEEDNALEEISIRHKESTNRDKLLIRLRNAVLDYIKSHEKGKNLTENKAKRLSSLLIIQPKFESRYGDIDWKNTSEADLNNELEFGFSSNDLSEELKEIIKIWKNKY